MQHSYLTFKNFPDKETAEDFADVLSQRGIPYYIEEDILVFDPSYANNALNKDYSVKIPQQDFTKATKAYEEYFGGLVDKVDNDYYLYSFSENELKEIVAKPDEWGTFDYMLAQKLLKEKGIEISEEEKDALKSKRYKELAKPQKETASNILGYYLVSVLFFPIGLIIGWIWGFSKKNLPDGKRVFAYEKDVRQHGQTIFLVSMILFMLTVLGKVLQLY